ncbi:efflux transporter outer membrane subunit [Pseudomonas sp. UL073]|uniref:Efflux transporter outer membrane subunit n=1 Tax=Zestomonas insulae TaxID=2809017 RepID=A0ABS2IF90_9GAMM|nr:efflux transporter outer membrane subunit [Pseudomonas insulae]MBM7061759.1 efflux transporter outer membrane subunit [Pseudomonas insulae]
MFSSNRVASAVRASALLGSLLLLGACVSSKGLETQGKALDAAALQAGQSLGGVPLSAAAWPQQDWWRALNDAQLNGLIDEALRGSPDLQISDARARQAGAFAMAQNAARMPKVSGTASYSGLRIPESVAPEPLGGTYAAISYLSLGFSYDFDLWGGQRAAWEAALGQARAAQVDQQAARLTLSADVTRTYSDLEHAYVVRDLARDELARAEHLVRLSQQRMDAGLDSKVQLQQSQTLQASARQQLAATEQQIEAQRIALGVLLGQGPDRGLRIERPQALPVAPLALPSNLPAELLGRRPDVIAARWRVEAASKSIDAAKTEFYPNLNLGAMIGLAALGGADMLKASSRFYQVAPALSLPIFDGGRLRANLEEHDADYDLAVAQYNKTLVRALGDVSENLSVLRSLREQIDAQQQARDIAQTNYQLALRRYGEGVGNYLDVLTVEQQLLLNERQLANLNAEQFDASVRLVQALGGGYQPDQSPLAQLAQPNDE